MGPGSPGGPSGFGDLWWLLVVPGGPGGSWWFLLALMISGDSW